MSPAPLTRTRLRLLALTAAGVVALAGCSSDDSTVESADSGSSSAPAPSAAAPAASPAPCPLTATEIPAPVGSTTDLKVRPVYTPGKAPAPTAVQYADLVVGAGAQAGAGSQVAVKYVGARYTDGKVFDASWNRGPDETLPFGICLDGVIPGFAVGPTGMKVGGRRLIVIPSEFGYGAQGSPPDIPANATLVFIVDLVSVTA